MRRVRFFETYRLRAVLILVALSVPACRGQVWSVLDQANASAWTGGATNIALANTVSQTFVPSLSCLIAVEVGLKTGNSGQGGDRVTLQILNSAGVELISTSDDLPEGYEGFRRFNLAGGGTQNGLSVTPGQSLTIRLQDTGKGVFVWKYNSGNTYPPGQAYFHGSPFQNNDFLFKTWGATFCPGQDQANAPAWTGGATNIAPANTVSQTFVPSLPCLMEVEAGLKTGNSGQGGDRVTLQILNSSGEVLSTASDNIPEGYEGFWRFSVRRSWEAPDGITITPSQPLTVRLQDTGKNVFWWKYNSGNTYPAGQAYFHGSPFQDNDFLFKTYGAATCPPGGGAAGQASMKCSVRTNEAAVGIHPWSGRVRPYSGYTAMTIGQQIALAQMRASALQWITRCHLSEPEWNVPYCPQSSNLSCDNIGSSTNDSNLFDGLHCLAGEGKVGCGWGVHCPEPACPTGVHCAEPVGSLSCLAVKNAQGSDGRWWRSPDHVGMECGKSFSRDMALGTLAYLATSSDKASATRWWNYIYQGPGKDFICRDDSGPLHDYCGLMHNYITYDVPLIPTLHHSNEYYGIFHDVWQFIGLTPPPDIQSQYTNDPDHDRSHHACNGLSGGVGFEDYLLADQYLIKQFVNTESSLDREGISCLVQRGPSEPLFVFLQGGSSGEVASLITNPKQCPATFDANYQQGKNQAGEGTGWYCLLMLDLVLGPVMDTNQNGIDDLLECTPPPFGPSTTGNNANRALCIEQCGKTESDCLAHSYTSKTNCVTQNTACLKQCDTINP